MTAPSRTSLGSWLALAAGLLACASLVWLAGPLLALGGWRPLEGAAARALLIAAVLLLPLATVLWRRLGQRHRAQQAAQAANTLDALVDQALLRLRAQPALVSAGWHGWQARWQQWNAPDPLLALPWVLVISLPGADARRALANAGFDLPLRSGAAQPCAWCITPQGVLIDVAEDLMAERHAQWQQLLRRLKQARPLQPVSAVLVLLPAIDRAGRLLGRGTSALSALQARLSELAHITGMVPPLHLGVTGCERLPGFPGAEVRQSLHREVSVLPLTWDRPGPTALLGTDAADLRRLIHGQVLPPPPQPAYAAGWLRRQRWWVRGGYAATALVVVGLALGWATSREQNLRLIAGHQGEVQRLEATLQRAAPAGAELDLPLLLPALDRLRDVVQYGLYTGWDARLGLFQGYRLQDEVQTARLRLLSEGLVPVLLRQEAAQLRTQLAAAQPDIGSLYTSLRVYLGLVKRVPLGPAQIQRVTSRLADAQPALTDALRASLRQQLGDLAQADLPPTDLPPSALADEALVAQARQWLAGQPLAALLVGQLQQRHLASGQAALSVAALAGGAGETLFTRPSGQPLSEGVPMLYTLQGIDQFVLTTFNDEVLAEMRSVLALPQSPTNPTAAANQAVPANALQRANAAANQAVLADALQRYQNDYIRAWDVLLSDIRLAPPADATAAARMAAQVEAADSPLAQLLRNAASQTAPAQRLNTLGSGPLLSQVDQHYEALHRLVSGQAPALNAALSHLAVRMRQPAASLATLPALKASADAAPQPLRNLFLQLMPQITDAVPTAPAAASTHASAADAEFSALQQQCQRSAANRYPLVANAKADMSLADFNALFGTGTGFDAYFQRWLAPLVDVGTQPWAWRAGSAAQRPVPGAALASFQQAANIREALFKPGSRQASMSVTLSVTALDARVPAAELQVNDQTSLLRVRQNAQAIDWPGQPNIQRISLGAEGGKAPELSFEGPWSLPRLLDALTLQPSRAPRRYFAKLTLGGQPAELGVQTDSALALGKTQLREFRCPAAAEPKAGTNKVPALQAKAQLVDAVRAKR